MREIEVVTTRGWTSGFICLLTVIPWTQDVSAIETLDPFPHDVFRTSFAVAAAHVITYKSKDASVDDST